MFANKAIHQKKHDTYVIFSQETQCLQLKFQKDFVIEIKSEIFKEIFKIISNCHCSNSAFKYKLKK
ncbi:hypothetical protein C7972_11231 [Arenibacter sp. ARW7G5Y1]|nr:hypothetical protein C7972_11231 [Arenibacter sp. ARW7G5Y1]